MKTLKRVVIQCAIALGLLLPSLALAKGDGVGFTMSGTLTNFAVSDETCRFTFTGTVQITQWHGASSSTVEIVCTNGFAATVTQNHFFVATHPTLNAAAVRNDPKALSGILKLAAGRGRVIKFELADPKIAFGDRGEVKSLESSVVRATDWDLH